MNKQSLREHFKALRANLAARPEEHARRSLAVCEALVASALWHKAARIFAYYPVRGEVNTKPLVSRALAEGKTLLFPRCLPDKPGCMEMAACTCLDNLAPAAFRIPEPERHLPPWQGPWEGLLLAPGLAFDLACYRLGYGGGYYDRFLATYPLLTSVGLAFNFQMAESLPREKWDIPLTHVCSEDCLC